MSGGELFCAFFFYPPSVIIEAHSANTLEWMDAKRVIPHMDSTELGFNITSEYGKVESHHLWLHSVSKSNFRLPKTPGCSIDKKGFHQDQVELEIVTGGFLEVEKIGFRVI